jgi:ABC-type oligopeptide transport system ATPase subunit
MIAETDGTSRPPLLSFDDVSVTFGKGATAKTALNHVSLDIASGETLGLIGESGSGKTTLARVLVGLESVSAGAVTFDGRTLSGTKKRTEHGIQMVFQDPRSSLNPNRTIEQSLSQQFRSLSGLTRHEIKRRMLEMIERVGLPENSLSKYPEEFSGGQRQRIGIARALLARPKLIVCDEAVSALDLSIQAQIVNLLADLKDELGTSYLFISHDISVVSHLADRVAVLYRGNLVEVGLAEQVLSAPGHPYTAKLIASSPVPDPAVQRSRRLLASASTAGGNCGADD